MWVVLLMVVLLLCFVWIARLRRRLAQLPHAVGARGTEAEEALRVRLAQLEADNRVLQGRAEACARTEAALAESEKRFRTAFRTSPDSININRLEDGLYEDINDGFTEITGYTADEVIGKTSLEIDIWADPSDRAVLVEGLKRDGVVRNMDARFRMKDGTVVRGLISARVIELGGVPHILSVARSIEDWVAARRAVEESEARLQSVLESAPLEFFAFDPKGRCTVVNSRARERWGEAVGRRVEEIPGSPGAASRWVEGVRRAAAGETLEDDWEERRDGRRVVYHSIVAPIRGPDGILGVQALNVDVTERQELEDALSHAQKLEAVGTLASGVAHDFNNLLQGILGYLELCGLIDDLPPKAREYLGRIEAASRSAAELVRSLLAYSRREHPRLEPVDLNGVVDEVVALLRRTVPKMIAVEVRLAKDLPRCTGDARQLQQVLLNLGTNARDAMPEGGTLTFETGLAQVGAGAIASAWDAGPGSYVRCRIIDTGVGMDPDTLLRVFDPFFTTKGVGEGTGLGLSMAYGVVKNHRGFLTCRSAPGEGTTFEMHLPVCTGPVVEEAAEARPAHPPHRAHGTVLVVDDEPFVRDVVGSALEASGYQVRRAESGEAALETFGANGAGIDLVLLDLGMPGMGGRKCLAELRRRSASVPVLVASGYARSDQAKGIMEDGASGFLGKPFVLETLTRRVAELLEAREGAGC